MADSPFLARLKAAQAAGAVNDVAQEVAATEAAQKADMPAEAPSAATKPMHEIVPEEGPEEGQTIAGIAPAADLEDMDFDLEEMDNDADQAEPDEELLEDDTAADPDLDGELADALEASSQEVKAQLTGEALVEDEAIEPPTEESKIPVDEPETEEEEAEVGGEMEMTSLAPAKGHESMAVTDPKMGWDAELSSERPYWETDFHGAWLKAQGGKITHPIRPMYHVNAHPTAAKSDQEHFLRSAFGISLEVSIHKDILEHVSSAGPTDSGGHAINFGAYGKVLVGKDKIATTKTNPHCVKSMVMMAALNKWNPITVTGTQKNRDAIWLEAKRQGLTVIGHEPSEKVKEQWLRDLASTRERDHEKLLARQPDVAPQRDVAKAMERKRSWKQLSDDWTKTTDEYQMAKEGAKQALGERLYRATQNCHDFAEMHLATDDLDQLKKIDEEFHQDVIDFKEAYDQGMLDIGKDMEEPAYRDDDDPHETPSP